MPNETGNSLHPRTMPTAGVSWITALRCSITPALWLDERGVIAVITALALTALIGIAGLALDVGMWYRSNRAMQNAADAAVIAAALNGTGSYQSEAKAVAAQYGFVDGANGVTVTALNNQTCPDGATDCYQVTVAQTSPPRYFPPVVGNFSPNLAGAAMAGGSQTHSYCLLALGGSGTDPDEWRAEGRSHGLQLNVQYRRNLQRSQPQRHLWRRAQDQ